MCLADKISTHLVDSSRGLVPYLIMLFSLCSAGLNSDFIVAKAKELQNAYYSQTPHNTYLSGNESMGYGLLRVSAADDDPHGSLM